MTDDPSQDATYTFYPAVRAGHRPGAEFDGTASSIPDSSEKTVTLTVAGYDDDDERTEETVSVPVHVYGPGDVTGIDDRGIVRREPEPRTDAYPPRQFPVVEFDRPDLPWLFSPQRADDRGRVHPWLCLVVVDRDHPDVQYEAVGPGSLPALEAPVSELPDPTESYLWAHAQHLGAPSDGEDVPAIEAESTHSRSRLVCPRNLEAHTRYRACVVPVFEPGRQVGLGRDPDPAIEFAWDDDGTVTLPVYDSWEFATAPEGDFASLATDLEPVVLGEDVGMRTVDVSKPGPITLKRPGEGEASTVGLEGALQSPAAAALDDPYEPSLEERLRAMLNRARAFDEELPEDVVAPLIYGRWHAARSTVGSTADADADWFDQLNADPRYRLAAGFGTTVIGTEQEALMAHAWEQFGDLREANRYLCQVQLICESLRPTYEKLASKSDGRLLQLSGPVHKHVFDERLGETVFAGLSRTRTPVGMTTPKFRGLTNPHGPLAARDGVTVNVERFAGRFVTGEIPGLVATPDSLERRLEGDIGAGSGGVFQEYDEDGTDRGRESGQDGTGRTSGPDVDVAGDLDVAGNLDVADTLDVSSVGDAVDRSTTSAGDVGWGTLDVGGEFSEGGDMSYLAATGPTGPTDDPRLPAGVRSAAPDTDLADERREARLARHRVLALCESVERHCLTARSDVRKLKTAIDREDEAAVAAALGAEPTVYHRAASIVPNTVEPLARALSKLLVEPRPPTVAASLTSDVADEHCNRLRESGEGLVTAVETAMEAALEASSDPDVDLRAAKPPLSGATRTLSRMVDDVDRIRGMVAVEPADPAAIDSGASGPVGPGRAGPASSMLMSHGFGGPAGANLEAADVEAARSALLDELNPDVQLPLVAADRLNVPTLPERIDPLERIMAAPTFERPMAESLVDLDPEHMLPGVGDVPKDSVGLVQTNPAFVEAFLAGLNHEMARLLRWRRYPTDKRGTYFRQFWDHRISPDVDVDLEDVEALHTWSGTLGTNDRDGDDEPTAVLLVRGELLRRYPNTVIYAAKAIEDENGEKDDADRIPALPNLREYVEEGDAHGDDDLQFPQFSGTLGADIHFFGFDLTVPEARSDPYHLPEEPAPDDHDDEGWFFVLEEPAADVRFGMLGGDDDPDKTPIADTGAYVDVEDGPPSWVPGWIAEKNGEEGGMQTVAKQLDLGDSPVVNEAVAGAFDGIADDDSTVQGGEVTVDDGEDEPEYNEVTMTISDDGDDDTEGGDDNDEVTDVNERLEWGKNSAHMADITWRKPMRVAIHASELLPDPEDDDPIVVGEVPVPLELAADLSFGGPVIADSGGDGEGEDGDENDEETSGAGMGSTDTMAETVDLDGAGGIDLEDGPSFELADTDEENGGDGE